MRYNMKVAVRLYKRTGYDLINRPDSSATVEALATTYVDISDIYVVQNFGLTEIRLPILYKDTKEIDYIRLTASIPSNVYNPDTTASGTEAIYYILTAPPEMINEHDCLFHIREDFIATLGLSQSDFMTGQINIGHVPVDDWRWSTTEQQERYSPPGLLDLHYYEVGYDNIKENSTYDKNVNIVNSTVDIIDTAVSKKCLINNGLCVLDTTHDGNVSVVVPQCEPVNHSTQIFLKRLADTGGGQITSVAYKPPYGVFHFHNLDNANAKYEQAGLSILRSLGLFDSIIASYDVDGCYINSMVTSTPPSKIRTESRITTSGTEGANTTVSENKITSLSPVAKSITPTSGTFFNFQYTPEGSSFIPKNKAVYFGRNNNYYLVSKCTGNMMEIKPEDAMTFAINNPYVPSQSAPEFIVTADLRVGGSPKIIPLYLNRRENITMAGVNGMSWANHQNTFIGQYGTVLANNNYRISSSNNLQNSNFGQLKNIVDLLPAALGSLELAGGTLTAGGSVTAGGLNPPTTIGSTYGAKMAIAQNKLAGLSNNLYDRAALQMAGTNQNATIDTAMGVLQNELNYRQQKAKLDYANAMATLSTVAPTIEFPFSESSREIFGNYFTIYRTIYTEEQMKRLDYFYTLWGYQVGGVDILDTTYDWLNSRNFFNYLSMTNVSFKRSNLSMLERQGLAEDLASVRLWHNRLLPADWQTTANNGIRQS